MRLEPLISHTGILMTFYLSIISMFYLFEFCLKNMWNCSPTQQTLSHSLYDQKLYELFLPNHNLSLIICRLSVERMLLCRGARKPDVEKCNLCFRQYKRVPQNGSAHKNQNRDLPQSL
jgi:hypothetical protein